MSYPSYPDQPQQPQQPPHGSGGQPGGGDQPPAGNYGGQPGGYPGSQPGSQPGAYSAGGGGYSGGGSYSGGGGGYSGGGGHSGGEQRNGFGIAALVLGILSIVTCVGGVLLGIPAVVLGVLGRKRAARGEANNGGMALAGIITGVIGFLLSAVIIGLGVAGGMAAYRFAGTEIEQLSQCVQEAQGDAAAKAECQRQYQEQLERKFGTPAP